MRRPDKGGSRAREGPGSLGCGSPTSARNHYHGTATVAVMVTDEAVSRPNPCWDGHPLAAAEHARQMRIARIRLDRLLYGEPALRDPGAEWPSYDVAVLGLSPHDRELCDSCQAAGT